MPPRPGKFVSPCSRVAHATAFSLIEAVIAIGIVSLAMVSLLGVIPIGLKTFRSAAATSTEAEVVRDVVSRVLAADATNLVARTYYFTDEGLPVASAGDPQRAFTVLVSASKVSGGLLTTNASQVIVSVVGRTATETNSYFAIVPSAVR
ncbi:Verru_Chthon cassette protein B [Verrucomicrobium sp. GAS474]|uniref:Verru_Chthon cassette protein B n=1 Tax=Verrucomicrobium sp. GAS474 TaxID=1882831 RepID=UPI0012FF9643|nr:Verru_Chthon cassette protein B [Verrucomicrobium sp. GAS474]